MKTVTKWVTPVANCFKWWEIVGNIFSQELESTEKLAAQHNGQYDLMRGNVNLSWTASYDQKIIILLILGQILLDWSVIIDQTLCKINWTLGKNKYITNSIIVSLFAISSEKHYVCLEIN